MLLRQGILIADMTTSIRVQAVLQVLQTPGGTTKSKVSTYKNGETVVMKLPLQSVG